MKTFQVITDTTSDLKKKLRDEYGVDYVKMVFTINNKNYMADLDWKEITPTDYYNLMRAGSRSITGLVPTKEFEEVFSKYLEQGLDVLYISCSSSLSGSINNAKIVSEELKEKYPDRRIVCIDSLRCCMGQGLLAMDAGKMSLEGKSLDETFEYIKNYNLNYNIYATVGSLEWLKKAGRVKASAAFFGNLFGVKPIILTDAAGANYAFKKVKGRKTSLDELVNIVISNSNEKTKCVYIEHADSIKDAMYVATKIKDSTNIDEISIVDLGPIIGATTGPDTIIVNFYGKKVTIVGDE